MGATLRIDSLLIQMGATFMGATYHFMTFCIPM
jgi:hypothetical protein